MFYRHLFAKILEENQKKHAQRKQWDETSSETSSSVRLELRVFFRTVEIMLKKCKSVKVIPMNYMAFEFIKGMKIRLAWMPHCNHACHFSSCEKGFDSLTISILVATCAFVTRPGMLIDEFSVNCHSHKCRCTPNSIPTDLREEMKVRIKRKRVIHNRKPEKWMKQ